MASRTVVTLTTGEAGSGKSYARCAQFITDRFLRDHDGPHVSNFPLGVVPEDHSFPPEYEGETFRERIARSAAKRHRLDESELLERIELIPAEELVRWETGESGPWEYFEGRNLQDMHIAIDEVHNYCPSKGEARRRERWQQWLGEIRHQGATVEFMTQTLMKAAKELRDEAGLHIEVKNTETERDPLFGILLGDWYELRAGFITGRYSSNVMEQERRSADGRSRNWTARRIFALDPWYFRFYDSFSKPQKGGNRGRAQRRQFEKLSRAKLLWWFISSNAGRLIPRLAFLLAVSWLLFGQYLGLGGGPWVMKAAIARIQSYGTGFAPDEEDPQGARLSASLSPTSHSSSAEGGARSASDVAASLASDLEDGPETPAEITAAVVELRTRLEELEAENVALRSVIDRTSELAAIFKDGITFRNGFTYYTGEEIDYGPLAGLTVVRVLWRQRAAELDDGSVIRMGAGVERALSDRVLESAADVRAGRPTRVPRVVPGADLNGDR